MPELPVTLIQELHARQACLQEALTTLRATLDDLQQTYIVQMTELHDIDTLLQRYALPEPTQETEDIEDASVLPCSPSAPTIPDCLDAILLHEGPAGAESLRRTLYERYHVDMPKTSLFDLLERGRHAGRYAKHGRTWHLATDTTRQEESA